MPALSLGVDFGTTNTVIALAADASACDLVGFDGPLGRQTAIRSALSFHAPPARPSERVIEAGPWAIEAYVEDPGETRFLQSFKSFAAQASFTETQILGRRFRFEDLLSTFLLKVREHAGTALAHLPKRVIVGGRSPSWARAPTRPWRFPAMRRRSGAWASRRSPMCTSRSAPPFSSREA